MRAPWHPGAARTKGLESPAAFAGTGAESVGLSQSRRAAAAGPNLGRPEPRITGWLALEGRVASVGTPPTGDRRKL